MLAIVIPYYKFAFFEETLKSLANQTDKRFKVYIGDDASPENPSALLEKYKGQFDFEYHRFEENLGATSLVKQWERCIAKAGDEEWIMILGDDDYLSDNVVEHWYKNYNQFYTKVNLIRFATKVIYENILVENKLFEHPKLETAKDSFYRRFKGLTRSSLSEFIFSRQSFKKFGFQNYPLAWHSDDYAWLNFSNNKPIYSINESYVFIRVSSTSITGNIENFEQKNIATEQFLKDCITKKLKIFNKSWRLELLLAYEVTIKKGRKLNLNEWLFLMKYYFKHFKFISFLKFNRRFLISIFKR